MYHVHSNTGYIHLAKTKTRRENKKEIVHPVCIFFPWKNEWRMFRKIAPSLREISGPAPPPPFIASLGAYESSQPTPRFPPHFTAHSHPYFNSNTTVVYVITSTPPISNCLSLSIYIRVLFQTPILRSASATTEMLLTVTGISLRRLSVLLLFSFLGIVTAEDPYRFLNWNVTYGDIYPLGVRQQVCRLFVIRI